METQREDLDSREEEEFVHNALQKSVEACIRNNVVLQDEPVSPRCFANDNDIRVTPRRSPRLLSKKGGISSEIASPGVECESDLVAEEPRVGMVFETMVDLEKFYKKYAKSIGFGVIRPQGSYRTGKERRATTWRCSCSGDPDAPSKRKLKQLTKEGGQCITKEKESGFPHRRKSKKCFCEAKLYATINPVKQWVIRSVNLEHTNHTPKPRNAKMVKEYRMESLSDSLKRRILSDYHAGVPISKIMNCLAHERGGYHNMPFTEADIRHVVHEHRRLKMKGGDTNALISYFEKMRRDNPSFYHTHRVDSEGYMKDIFWVDPRSIAAYEEFSDVVCFDTTYLTNQYALPFANFVGVNHHGQTILFGCALISNEDSETFEWVFRQWLQCMNGIAPGGILTDQAAAMRKPLEDVMPHTRHRWCIWHILQKLPYKLGYHEKYADIKDALLNAVYNSLGPVDFEIRWKAVLIKFELENNDWLSVLFVERHIWVPCYMTDHFWAGMRSTQRCESINSFFDQYLTRDTPFCEFGEKYVQAVEKRIFQENEADLKSEVLKQYLCTAYALERMFRNYYTSEIFKRFQSECQKITYVMVDCEHIVDSDNMKFVIQDRVWVKQKDVGTWMVTDKRTSYCVDFNVHSREASCNCYKFQTEGIMCRHLVRVYDKLQVDEIPPKFILRRWRKDVERKHMCVKVAYHDLSRTKEVARLHTMSVAFEPISELASKSDDATEIVLRGLERIEQDLRENKGQKDQSDNTASIANSNVNGRAPSGPMLSDELNNNLASPMCTSSGCHPNSGSVGVNGTPCSCNSSTHSVKDPPVPKKRGRPRGSGYKSSMETGWYSKKKDGNTDNKKKRGRPPKAIPTKTTNVNTLVVDAEDNCYNPTQESPAFGNHSTSECLKIPVKRRKSVSFAYNVGVSEVYVAQQDDLVCRNELSFDNIDPLLNLS